MPGPFIVGYDGSPAATRALEFAVTQAAAAGLGIVLVHVLEWSPYSFLSREELEERHMRRKEELVRAEVAVLAPAMDRMKDRGVAITPVIRYGHSAEILSDCARDEAASQIIVGRDGAGGLSARIFGSTAATLVQIAPVPCTIVP